MLTSVRGMPTKFKADKPFMYFLIYNNKHETSTLLFNGKLNDPTLE